MARDWVREARDLGRALEDAGHREAQTRLEDAIVGGATGSEILMALRARTAEVGGDADVPAPIRDRARRLHDDLGRALR